MRNFPNWLSAYCEYAGFSEAPRQMIFWCGVSAIAGALRRRVWIDMAYFKWYPNFYILLVAPPGIVSKSTTAGIAMNLLRRVPGVNFGPDVVTWQALVTAFAASSESFMLPDGTYYTMSSLTIESSEFGNLLNPADRDMVDLLVTLWDSKQGAFKKLTKMAGDDTIENPWINLIACTTPSWIAGNFPEYIIGGGFTSRCLFIYAEDKGKYVAYPGMVVPKNLKQTEAKLIQDLEHIAINLIGEYKLTPDAVEWGISWYEHHYKNRPAHLDDDRFGGYIARKQTHIHKLSMVIAASLRDELFITQDDLAMANQMVTDLESDMTKVFSRIGRSEDSAQAERFINFIKKSGEIPYDEAYRFVYSYFPGLHNFEDILNGAVRSNHIEVIQKGNVQFLRAKNGNG